MKIHVNFTRCQLLVYHSASFLGLAPFSLRDNNFHPASFARKTYAAILAALSIYWPVVVADHHRIEASNITAFKLFVQVMYVAFVTGSVFSSLLNSVLKSNKVVDISSRIVAIKHELEKLGIEDKHEKERKKFYARIIFINFVNILIRTILNSAHNDEGENMGARAMFWFTSFMMLTISHNAILIFTETLICIRQLLESLNNGLQGTTHLESGILSSHDQQNSSVIRVQAPRGAAGDAESIHLLVGDVEKIGKLHKELCDLANATNHLFTLPIIFAILRQFIRLLASCYFVYSYAQESLAASTTADTIVPFIQLMITRTTLPVLQIFLIADACTSLCRVSSATKTTLFQVWNKFYPEELRNEFYKFSLELLEKPVVVSAFGFFDLGYSFLFKILYAVLAYFIIMVQLDTSKLNTGT